VGSFAPFVAAATSWAKDGSRPTGEACLDDIHCATGNCTLAPDDPSVTYCTSSCSVDTDCPAAMRCEGSNAMHQHCVFAGSTPGARGTSWHGDRECNSGRCGGFEGVCTIRCFQDQTICGENQACLPDRLHAGERSCSKPVSDLKGFTTRCSMGHGSAVPPGPLWLVVGVLAFRIRSRLRRTQFFRSPKDAGQNSRSDPQLPRSAFS
jgi:hypothetical protein